MTDNQGFGMLKHFLFISMCLSTMSLNTRPLVAESSNRNTVEENWQTIWNQQQRIGYAHSVVSHQSVDGQDVIITDTLLSMTMKRFNQSLTIRQKLHSEELADGTLLKFTSTLENPPNSQSVLSGFVAGDVITLTSKVAERETTKTLTGMQGVRSSVYPERVIEDGKLKIGKPLELEIFEPQLGLKSSVLIEYLGDVRAGPEKGLREVKLQQILTGTTSIDSNVYCRQDWSIVEVVIPLMQMEMRDATSEDALKAIGDQKFDFALDTMVQVKGLKNPGTAKSVTYRIAVEGSSPSEIFAASKFQKIRKLNENTIELTVTSPGEADTSAAQPQVDRAFLEPSQFLESESAIIKKLAEQGGQGARAEELAFSLEKFVRGYVSDKNFSTAMATAAEVAKSKSGDCTEHAVLLAALLRSRKIPSRVAIGFVYSPQHQAFVGHMWTEAWLAGNWIPLDATLGEGGIGCGHLTISTSALSDQGNAPAVEFLPMLHLLGRTKIDVVEVIR